MTKEELENYEPKGDLKGFPKEIIVYMLKYQEEQGNKKDISVFEENRTRCEGFVWHKTKEGYWFWDEVIREKNFDLFFEKYPKQDNSQEFKVGDKVINIITGKRGKITYIETLNENDYPIFVNFNEAGFTLGGKCFSDDKYPMLLHYRDDYDYTTIDFNNLPKKQEPKRWRAEVGETYYSFTSNFKIEDYCEDNHFIDDEAYNSGNYFKTKEEAQEVTFKLKKYFKQLIKEEQEHEKN